ncbi:alkaline phosphatase family protein [Psychroserpens algicola]|uniref:alkaline phosphatase family protein n=1 Tax=Psychroserpens algicola TaxID=1719034 RepID=UPI001954E981|nr:alkaline phosphatase family protein [Psychroserpens algicola]
MKTEIKHIVYLMLENRSLDQLLGWLYDEHPPLVNIPSQVSPTYNGLKENTYFNLDSNGNKHYVVKGVDNMNVPVHDPHEKYGHVNIQLFDTTENQSCKIPPPMSGFYKDFASYHDQTHQIMQSYTPLDLPVINGLAKHFAVSDHYFCSVPTQTNCNRAFAAAGNSLGINDNNELEAFVNNRDFSHVPPHLSQPVGHQFNQKTMWNVLSDHGFDQPSDWMHYYSKGTWWEDLLGVEGYAYTRDLMTQLQPELFDQHFDKIDTFFERAKAGTLPKVCFLEPEWGLEMPIDDRDYGINGNDYHPPTNLIPGEAFVKKIYDYLTSNKEAWANTLFIINFDEHGGTYDHVGPSPCATEPWASDGTPAPKKENREEGFDFKRFGVRVPLLLISPRVPESTVFRAKGPTPFDHTSVIATILNMFGIPKSSWGLGGRTANAPTFECVFEGNPIRQDIPIVEVNKHPKTLEGIENTTPPNDIHLRMAHSLLHRVLKKEGLSKEEADSLQLPKLIDAETVVDLSKRLKAALKAVKNR